MDLSTVSNAASDATSGLPSQWATFVNDNIGSAAGQQAIVAAAANYGITDPGTVASLVNQATGMNVTPQQVTQVAQSVPAPAPAPAPAPSGTSLSNIAAPQFVGTTAPGAVGTTYGQASGDMITAASQANPALATALTSGNAAVNYDADTGAYNLIDKTTGAPIAGNYQVQVGPNGTGINIPSGNGMIQVTAQTDQSGAIAPVTAANVQNVGLNRGAGGFAGGPDAFMATAGPAIAAVFPAAAPYIFAYNSASAANKGKYGLALINALAAAGVYAGQNPDSQIGQTVNSYIDAVKTSLPQAEQDALGTSTTQTGSVPNVPSTSQIGDTTGLGSTNYSVAPSGSTGTGLNVQQGTGTNLFDTSGLNPNTGLANGIGLQAPGSTNLSSMGGGQGITVPSGTTATTPAGVLGSSGVTPTGTGGLPINTATGATVGTALSNINTGVTTPSTAITNTAGNVVGTPAGQNTSSGVLPAAAAAAGGAAVPAAAATGLTAAQIAALGTVGASLLNNNTLTNANNSAAATQAAAGQNAQNLIQGLYTQQGQLQSPYQQAGVNALNQLNSLGSGTYNIMTPTGGTSGTGTGSGYLTNQFNNQDLNAQLAPNYAFQLQQGQGQAQNAANVGGGLLSGNTLQGLNQYTQNYAQGAYQNAFTNYQTQRNNIYNTLAGQAGLGANANQQLSNLGGGLAQTYGNVTTGLAASAAGQQVANAQNQTNLLSNLTNAAVTAFAPTPATTTLKLTTA